jgi:ankyrin repeat protein
MTEASSPQHKAVMTPTGYNQHIKHAKQLYNDECHQESLAVYNTLITQLKQEFALKPHLKAIRETLYDAWESYASTIFLKTDLSVPDEIRLAKKEQNAQQFSLRSLFETIFLENEWKKQYLGKFGGPKPTTLSWKNYYLHCETTIDNDTNIANRLKWSVENGHINYCIYLLSNYEVSLNDIMYPNQQSMLSRAISRRHDDIAMLLLDHSPKQSPIDSAGWTPLHYAVYNGNQKIITRLLEEKHPINPKDSEGNRPLHIACYNRFFDIVKLLLEQGAKYNIQNNNGFSPLQLSFLNEDLQSTELLIEYGAECNCEDKFGRSLLHYSTAKNNTTFMELLITNKIDLNSKDKLGRTPLHYAAQFGNANAINVLIKNKCDINIADNFGVSPLICSAFFANSLETALLYEHGAR